MFKVVLESGAKLEAKSRKHSIQYAIDGSAPNPLEAVYASIVGCAGVFAKKACAEMGITDDGISIELKMVVDPTNPSKIGKIMLNTVFPERFTQEEKDKIFYFIEKCPVKGLIQQGGDLEFVIQEQ